MLIQLLKKFSAEPESSLQFSQKLNTNFHSAASCKSCEKLLLYGEDLLTLRMTLKLEYHPLSDIRNYLLLQTIAPTLHTVRPPSPSVT
jgi:hypothetical protein